MYDLRLKELDEYEIVKMLEDKIELSEYQKQSMRDRDFWRGIKVMVYEEPKRVKPIWRLTILFYWMFILIAILFLFPIHWIFTGTQSFNKSDLQVRIYKYWSRKLGIY